MGAWRLTASLLSSLGAQLQALLRSTLQLHNIIDMI